LLNHYYLRPGSKLLTGNFPFGFGPATISAAWIVSFTILKPLPSLAEATDSKNAPLLPEKKIKT
jgi:hypothetical protein